MNNLTKSDIAKLHLDKIGAPIATTIDCHGLTVDDAFREIESKINNLPGGTITIITGRSGDINRLLRLAVEPGGNLSHKIKDWTMPNPGCYKIRIRKEML